MSIATRLSKPLGMIFFFVLMEKLIRKQKTYHIGIFYGGMDKRVIIWLHKSGVLVQNACDISSTFTDIPFHYVVVLVALTTTGSTSSS